MASKIRLLRGVHILILHGNRNIAAVIKDPEMGRLSWTIWVNACNYKGLCKKEAGDMTMDADAGVMPVLSGEQNFYLHWETRTFMWLALL